MRVRINFGAIGKGYAPIKIAELLGEWGIKVCSYLCGTKHDFAGWCSGGIIRLACIVVGTRRITVTYREGSFVDQGD